MGEAYAVRQSGTLSLSSSTLAPKHMAGIASGKGRGNPDHRLFTGLPCGALARAHAGPGPQDRGSDSWAGACPHHMTFHDAALMVPGTLFH